MTPHLALGTAISLLTHEATTSLVGIATLLISALAVMFNLTRADRNRDRVIAAVRSAQRYGAPRGSGDLHDDLVAVEDALAAFPALRAHTEVLRRVVLKGWRDSRRRFEAAGRDPQLLATAVDADLDQKIEDVVTAIIARVRRPRWLQSWGAAREIQQLADAGNPSSKTRRQGPPAGQGYLVVSPEPIYQLVAELQRDVQSASRSRGGVSG